MSGCPPEVTDNSCSRQEPFTSPLYVLFQSQINRGAYFMVNEKKHPDGWRRRILLSTAAAALFGAGVLSTDLAGPAIAQSGAVVQLSQTVQAPISFAELVDRVKPAVVNVSTTQKAAASENQGGQAPFNVPPGYEEFFKRFFGEQAPRGRGGQPEAPPGETHSLGSGFVIDPAGWVVTNNHVIGDASAVSITLNDGTQLSAEIKGRDVKTDLVLLKVESATPLPFVAFGDSEKARVGDWVVAVGNPFGLGGTVTAGIISAHGRNINAGPYDDFIQTDAAINRGNSGGPMFNLAGEVIGINTAIFSPTGGNIGIGFAIPSVMARMVISELREKGHVERGWLGVQIQSLTPDLAAGMGLDQKKGALVADVIAGTPAAQAGLQRGDVILRFGDRPIDNAHDLPRLVATTAAGATLPTTIVRNGREQTLQVTIGRMPSEQKQASAENGESKSQLGLVVGPITPQLRDQMNLDASVQGVVVADVRAGSEAARKGVRPGDIIVEINRQPVAKPGEVAAAMDQARRDKRKAVVLLLKRENSQRFVALDLPA